MPFRYIWVIGVVLLSLTSCTAWLNDDLDNCSNGGVVVEFSPLYASDATFRSEATQIRLMVTDESDSCVLDDTYTLSRLVAADYCLSLPLPAGNYHILAWAGLQDTLNYTLTPERGVRISRDADNSNDRCFTPLWHGVNDAQVLDQQTTVVRLRMVQDVNTLVVLMQDTEGNSLRGEDFHFELTSSNGLLSADNEVLADPTLTYPAYMTGSSAIISDADTLMLARAELNTGRLCPTDDTQLSITSVSTGRTVLKLNLTPYLLMVRPQYAQSVGQRYTEQEYLDAQADYNLIFFVTPTGNAVNPYTCLSISVNGWIVRLNSVDF